MPIEQTERSGRIELIDFARGAALVAMAIYHFTWDLEFFGYISAGTTGFGGWKLFARCIASSFLFLVGVSLFLAHGKGVRWRGFWRRLAMVAGAAAAISVATYLAMPQAFIFFGILHQIALASVLGMAFLRLPAAATLLVAAAVIAAPHFLRSAYFDHPAWWWLGLAPVNPRSNDYVPVLPWFGAVLAGIASAKLAAASGLLRRLAGMELGRWARLPILAGRHSLAVYLIHQPVLIGSLWLFSQVVPPPEETSEVRFLQACEATCGQEQDTEFCTRYCVCMLGELERENMVDSVFAGTPSEEDRGRIETAVALCAADTERAMSEGGVQ